MRPYHMMLWIQQRASTSVSNSNSTTIYNSFFFPFSIGISPLDVIVWSMLYRHARTHIHMHTHFQLPKYVLFSCTSTNMTNKSPDFLNKTVLLPVHLVVVAVLPLCLLKCFWCLLLAIKHTERPMFIYITSFLHAFHIADLAGPTWWSHDVWPYFSVKYFAKNIHGKMLPQLN